MSPQSHRRTFISYSRINKEFALKLALELRSSGFDIWLDQLDIPTGSRWDDEVEQALEECEIFMVILTPASSTSDNVKDEIGYAIDSGKRILPILLENAKVPLRLRRFQYVDFTKKSYEEGVEGAKQLLKRLIEEPTIPRDEALSTAQQAPEKTGRSKETMAPRHIPEPRMDAQHKAVEETEGSASFKVEKEKQEDKVVIVPEAQPLKPSPVPPKIDSPIVPTTKKSRMPLVLGTAGVGFIAVVAFVVFTMMNGAGGEIPTTGVPVNNASAEEAAASPVPVLDVVEPTSTPKATQTQELAPPTNTLEPTAAPDTPTPENQRYFTEEFEGDLQAWPMFIADGRQSLEQPVITEEEFSEINVSASDGLYFFNIDRRQTYVFSFFDTFRYDNVRLDARVDSRNINVNKTSLICRYSPEEGWYEFRIANNGPYEIFFAKPNPHGLINYRSLANGNAKNIKPGNAVNEYSIVCQGDDNLSLYINGELIRTTSDLFKVLRTGKVGVAVSSINSLPVRVGIDWFTISEPE